MIAAAEVGARCTPESVRRRAGTTEVTRGALADEGETRGGRAGAETDARAVQAVTLAAATVVRDPEVAATGLDMGVRGCEARVLRDCDAFVRDATEDAYARPRARAETTGGG